MKTATEWAEDAWKAAISGTTIDRFNFTKYVEEIQMDAIKAAAVEAWTICDEVCTNECGPKTGCVRIANLNK